MQLAELVLVADFDGLAGPLFFGGGLLVAAQVGEHALGVGVFFEPGHDVAERGVGGVGGKQLAQLGGGVENGLGGGGVGHEGSIVGRGPSRKRAGHRETRFIGRLCYSLPLMRQGRLLNPIHLD